MNSISVKTPDYYHREYANDIGSKTEDPSILSQCQRVATVALPFISLYKPFGFALSLGMGSCRAVSNISDLSSATQTGSKQEIGYQLLQTAISMTSVACTILAHPLGMLVTTGQDLALESINFANHVKKGEYTKAIESSANILNNALYLSMFMVGGIELSIASLSTQILIGVYHSREELLKGNYLEAAGHAGMVAIRGNQLSDQVKILQEKWEMEALLKKMVSQNNSTSISNNTSEADSSSEQNGMLENKASNNKMIKVAISEGNNELVELFIKYGNNSEGIPALHYACLQGDERAVTMFLDCGACPNALSRQAFHPGLDVDDASWSGRQPLTPLDFAAKAGRVNVMKVLISRGAQTNFEENWGNESMRWSPSLHFAAKNDQKEAVILLLKSGALWQPEPLHWNEGNSRTDYSMFSALHVSARNGSTNALEALFEYGGADVYKSLYKDNRLLFTSIQSNQVGSMEWLIKRGIDVNAKDTYGCTPLHRAVWSELEILECLLKNKANPNIQDTSGKTSLFDCHRVDRAQLLVEYGVDVNKKDNSGQTAFQMLILQRYLYGEKNSSSDESNSVTLKIAEIILENGFDINQKDSKNETVLLAIKNKYDHYMKYQQSSYLDDAQKLMDWLISHKATL